MLKARIRHWEEQNTCDDRKHEICCKNQWKIQYLVIKRTFYSLVFICFVQTPITTQFVVIEAENKVHNDLCLSNWLLPKAASSGCVHKNDLSGPDVFWGDTVSSAILGIYYCQFVQWRKRINLSELDAFFLFDKFVTLLFPFFILFKLCLTSHVQVRLGGWA